MSDITIRVEHLSKRYQIGVRSRDRISDLCGDMLASLFSLATSGNGEGPDTVWALKDVSFEVKQGEFLGIIGLNGSGKSTLLKILSRITEPTQGRVEIRGRVGSLLEVGTGFDRELTGRENIYLNAAILGMKKAEIDRKYDEIVEFAEVERFIDTPVKHYSSGMYVRLGFSVAAHLEPDILIVDEVLAVGDAAFQQKCIGKMEEVIRSGRTVLFVSHSMSTVTSLPGRAILLDQGTLAGIGPATQVVNMFLEKIGAVAARGEYICKPSDDLPFDVTSIRTLDDYGLPTSVIPRNRDLVISIEGFVRSVPSLGQNYQIAVEVRTLEDTLMFRTCTDEQPSTKGFQERPGPFVLTCRLPADQLPHATYRLGVKTKVAGRTAQRFYRALEFDVVSDRRTGAGWSANEGVIIPRCDWSVMTPVE